MRGLAGVTRIGVTGSNGKTTTKEIIGGILARTAQTVKSRGNLNSEIGLPLVALRITAATRFAVFEMATNHPGEMAVLADIVRPNAALITNIGTAHIEFFGSREAIAEEKKQIFRFFETGDSGFLFEGEPFFRYLAKGVGGSIVPFGPESTTGYGGSRDLGLDGTAIDWEGLQIHFPLFGRHNLTNALGAIALCRAIGADREAVKAGLEGVEPIFGRSNVIRGPVTIVEDCYNANPDSMKAVLAYFDALRWDGRKLAVLGHMLELGDESGRAHLGIARLAVRLTLDRCVFYGGGWAAAAAVFEQPAAQQRCVWTEDFDTLLHILESAVEPGDLVVLKGSRGARLERLVDPLKRIAA
jgi:UDP-N-acetylmuramoyl-tripeptide--D-alanyl-D-alanine ligase